MCTAHSSGKPENTPVLGLQQSSPIKEFVKPGQKSLSPGPHYNPYSHGMIWFLYLREQPGWMTDADQLKLGLRLHQPLHQIVHRHVAGCSRQDLHSLCVALPDIKQIRNQSSWGNIGGRDSNRSHK